jgi:N-acetylglucosamine kinase-like BadF-type ATPase
MAYIIGIDQGSSKTDVIVANKNGLILGIGRSGGGDHFRDGMEYAMGQVRQALVMALNQAAIELEQNSLISAGLTGADWPHEYQLLKEALIKETGIKKVKVYNDCLPAMRGGLKEPYGAVLCAGSGLNCAIRSPEGEEFVFGYYIDDEDQGGTALGRRILRAVFDGYSGVGEDTALTARVLEYFNIADVNSLLESLINDRIPNLSFKELVPLAFEVATHGDLVTLALLRKFGEDMAKYVVAGLKRFNLLKQRLDLVLSGGVFKSKVPILQESVTTLVHQFAPKVNVVEARYEPVVGAVLLALDHCYSLELPSEVVSNIDLGCKKWGLLRK